MPVVTEVVLTAPADLPSVLAGEVAAASCLSGCRVLGSAQEEVDTLLHDHVLQPAQALKKDYQTVSLEQFHYVLLVIVYLM